MIEWIDIAIRLVVAAVFGGLVGLERERKNWTAGLRTHMLVCVGSSLIMMVSTYGFFDVLKYDYVDLDPSRVAAQVISGIGFIGAGTILFSKEGTVRGLTTAAGLWTVAGIGLATGGGMYFAAGVTTLLALIILWAIQPIERKYAERFIFKVLTIVASDDSGILQILHNVDSDKDIPSFNFTMERKNDEVIYKLLFHKTNRKQVEHLIDELQNEKSVKKVEWQK